MINPSEIGFKQSPALMRAPVAASRESTTAVPSDGVSLSAQPSSSGILDPRAALAMRASAAATPAATSSAAAAPRETPPLASLIDRDRVRDLFLELATIPGPSRKERKVADAIMDKLRAMGYEPREDGAAKIIRGNTGNVLVDIPGTVPDAPPLIFISHLDTTPEAVGNKPVIRDGVIYSDGKHTLGSDNRAGCTEILEALRIMKENDIPHPPLQIIFSPAEELGLLGSEALKEADLHGKLGFAVDSFHPNEIYWGWGGPLFKGNPDQRDHAIKAAQEAFRHASNAELEPRNSAEGFLLDFTRDGIRAIQMEPEERQIWGASSDAASLREKGIPAITIGAGEQDPHTFEEHVSIDDLAKSTELILALMVQANGYVVDEQGKVVPRTPSPTPEPPPAEPQPPLPDRR